MNNNIYITRLRKQGQKFKAPPPGPRVVGPKPDKPPEQLPAKAVLDTGEPPKGDMKPIDVSDFLESANKIISNFLNMISPMGSLLSMIPSKPQPSPVSSEPIPGIGNLALLGLATLALYTFLSPKKKKEERD
ncbi:MAG: hypothetical protein ABIK19_06315 [candidate division WOR-3 bacterium]